MHNSPDIILPIAGNNSAAHDPDPPSEIDHAPIPLEDPATTRKSSRIRKALDYLKDFHCNFNQAQENGEHSTTCKVLYPISLVHSYHSLSPSHLKYALVVSTMAKPNTYNQAIKSHEWVQAMKNELSTLEAHNTWSFTQMPRGKTAIGCRWVYKLKHNAGGIIQKHKARLVAKGYTQQEGVDFLYTFSPVAKLTTIRLLLAIAATQNWDLQQLDVDNAFLHGDLHEEVYMQLPPGLDPSTPNQLPSSQITLWPETG